MGCSRLARMAILIIVGIYFLIFHQDPLPLNHEFIGIGKGDLHIAHAIIGLILIVGGVVVWRKSRTVTTPAAPTATVKQ